MSLLGRIASALTSFTSNKELRPYEDAILRAWRDTLDPNEKRILDEQLQDVKFVQRQAGDAKVVFYYGDSGVRRTFSNLAPDLHVATVVLRPHGATPQQYLNVKIFVHRGKFFSIEFPKRPERYLELHHMEMDTLHVDEIESCSLIGR
jgi:hypothetical protein